MATLSELETFASSLKARKVDKDKNYIFPLTFATGMGFLLRLIHQFPSFSNYALNLVKKNKVPEIEIMIEECTTTMCQLDSLPSNKQNKKRLGDLIRKTLNMHIKLNENYIITHSEEPHLLYQNTSDHFHCLTTCEQDGGLITRWCKVDEDGKPVWKPNELACLIPKFEALKRMLKRCVSVTEPHAPRPLLEPDMDTVLLASDEFGSDGSPQKKKQKTLSGGHTPTMDIKIPTSSGHLQIKIRNPNSNTCKIVQSLAETALGKSNANACKTSGGNLEILQGPQVLEDHQEGSHDTRRDHLQPQTAEEDCEPSPETTPALSLSNGLAQCDLPSVGKAPNHVVLFSINFVEDCAPKCTPSHLRDIWEGHLVLMPYSRYNTDAVDCSLTNHGSRWECIRKALQRKIVDSYQLEKAIKTYNSNFHWDFSVLHKFFTEEPEEDSNAFFSDLLPCIIKRALELPSLVTQPVPLMSSGSAFSLSLSQLQVSSLLANAFLSTFPHRNSPNEFQTYPTINFNTLFAKTPAVQVSLEKLKCLFNYFKRVTQRAPIGVITFCRRVLSSHIAWSNSAVPICRLEVDNKGKIENGKYLLQVDFCNKYIGGGVLGSGCLQEEIRFLICPELIVSRLFTECLKDNEALVISGVECYSKYEGYSNSFKFNGDFVDDTPFDSSRRRCTSIVAIDATDFSSEQEGAQYDESHIIRELGKAYAGFSASDVRGTGPLYDHLIPVATGKWGCGAFQGNKWLKALVQLLAASQAQRDVVYFTCGDIDLHDQLVNIHALFIEKQLTVGDLYKSLLKYCTELPSEGLLNYFYNQFS